MLTRRYGAYTREMRGRDLELTAMIDFLENDIIPTNDKDACKILLTSDNSYVGQDGLLTTLILIEGVMLVNLFLILLCQLHYVLKFSLMYMIILLVLILA